MDLAVPVDRPFQADQVGPEDHQLQAGPGYLEDLEDPDTNSIITTVTD